MGKLYLYHMQQSTACLHFARRTTSLRVGGRAARRIIEGHKCAMSAEMAVWLSNCLYLYSYLSHNKLGVAACLACVAAAAVDRQARLPSLAWCGGVNWTIALNEFRLQIFYRSATVLSCPESNSRDTDKTVLSCVAWRCEVALR